MEVRKNPHEPAQVRGSRQKKTNRISGWSFLIGGGVATRTKISYINTLGVVRVDAERCGI